MDLNLPEKRVFIGPASFWKRLLAFVLDLFLLDFFVLGAFNAVSDLIIGDAIDFMAAYALLQHNESYMSALMLVFMLVVMIVMAYFILLQYAVGQTLGGIILNIHVVQQVSEKKFVRASFWQCVLRNIFMIPAVPFIFLWVVDPLYYFFARRGQRLTEWLSNTRVVEQFTI